jgi:hypothetical protein
MRPTNKSTKTERDTEKREIVDNFVPLFTKSVERVAELQKKSLELVAEQNAEVIGTWKKAFSIVPGTPGVFMLDMFGQIVDRYIETQKDAIDLTVEQTHAVAGLAKDRGGYVSKMSDGVTGVFQKSLEHSVAAQKKALDSFAEQNKTMYEEAKRQFRFSNTPATEAFQTGLDALIETQKTMLDIASKPLHSTRVV